MFEVCTLSNRIINPSINSGLIFRKAVEKFRLYSIVGRHLTNTDFKELLPGGSARIGS